MSFPGGAVWHGVVWLFGRAQRWFVGVHLWRDGAGWSILMRLGSGGCSGV